MAVSVVESPAVRYGYARQALLQATIELAARVGLHAVTVAELSGAARVGPRTFYNHFADLDDVFFEACEQMHRQLRQTIGDAYEVEVDIEAGNGDEPGAREGDEPGCGGLRTSKTTSRVRAQRCVEALFAFVRADAVRAQVLFVQSHAGGPAITTLRRETIEWLITLVQGPVAVADVDADVPDDGPGRLLAEMAVGGINEVLSSRISRGELDRLEDWVPWAVETLMWSARTGR